MINTETFIKKATKIHGEKYDYSKSLYTKSCKKIIIRCLKHGEFEQIANNHLRGYGCPICAGVVSLDKEKFIKKSKNIHGEKYDYSKVSYVNNKKKVEIICDIHGSFTQRPDMHLSGQGCPLCAGLKRNTLDFIIESNLIHENKYDYSLVEYNGCKEKVKIICPIHGEFSQKTTLHLRGSGCPLCSESKGERKINSFLIKNGLKIERQKTFEKCINPKTGKKLSFDFYLPDFNLCIEYDGEYHYRPWRLYSNKIEAQKKFSDLKYRDKIKTKFLKKENIGLLRIPYFKFKNINKIIFDYLFKKV